MPRFLHTLALGLALATPLAPHAQTAPEPTTPPPIPAAPASAATGIAVGDANRQFGDRIPPQQQVWLQAGDDRFPGRYIGDLTGAPRGSALILHDSGQHPSWPFTVAALLEELPLQGWDTLAIELPAPAAVGSPQAAPADPATSADPPAAALPSPLEQRVQARIDAALLHLAPAGRPAPFVAVIAFGSGAPRVAETVQARAGSGDPAPLRVLAMVDALNTLPGVPRSLPQLLPASDLPVQDLIQGEDDLALAAQEARRRSVLHQRGRIYRTLVLPPLNATSATDRSLLIKRVRGFLQQQAPLPNGGSQSAPAK